MGKKINAILLLTFMMCIFASCSKHEQISSWANVPDDALFFESTELVLGDQYLSDDSYAYTNVKPVYYTDQYLYLVVSLDNDTYLEKYDYKGNSLAKTDIGKLSSGQNYSMNLVVFGEDEHTYLITSECDYNSEKSINSLYLLSEDGNELTKCGVIDLEKTDKSATIGKAVIVNEEIFIQYQYLENSIFHNGISVADMSGKCIYNADLEGNIFQCNHDDGGDVIFSMVDTEGNFSFRRFNVKERSLETLVLEDKILNTYQHASIGCDGNLYLQHGTRLLKYDPTTKEETEYLDYNYCESDLYSLENGFIDYIDDTKIIMLDLSSWRNEAIGRCKMTVLEKTDNNPFSGRKIIDVAEIWGINKVLSEGVKKYNSESSEYFTYVSDRYDVNVVEIPQMYSDIVSNADLVSAQTYIVNSLIQDIRNGEGPDIVIGLGDVTQINNDPYLKDLNLYIDGDNGINREDYFQNAFKAFSSDDKQYQLPLSIQIEGIMTNSKNAPANGIGYTYDEYGELVSSVCNGKEPFVSSGFTRYETLKLLFAAMQDDLIDQDKGIDLNNDMFRKMTEYVSKSIPESSEYSSDQSTAKARWTLFYDIYYDMTSGSASFQSWDVYGAPSLDGRGPMVTGFNTVAITTSATDDQIAWDLIKCLLSEEVQSKHITENPINTNAFEQYAVKAIDDANVTLGMQSTNVRLLDQSDIDRYKNMLMKAECSSFVDTQIFTIIDEEIQPYYQGSKSIDEIIPIISDRCQTVLDERK